MATFDGNDLKKWRESLGISAADLAEKVSCDVSTVHKYESGKLKMDPDVLYQICSALGDTRKWQVGMRTMYPSSYARVHPEPILYDLPGVIMKLYSTVRELEDLERNALNDGADGEIDSLALHEQLKRQCEEMTRAAQSALSILKRGESG